jgi:hypothetical protein
MSLDGLLPGMLYLVLIYEYLGIRFSPNIHVKIQSRRMASSGMLRRVALVRTDVSEELSGSFIRVARVGELGTTLAVISN